MKLGVSEFVDCAHFLPGHAKCGQLHGHTYKVDVAIEGDHSKGMVVDFADLKALYHGHSYTGNQLGCAVALANLDLFEREDVVGRVQEASRTAARLLEGFAGLAHVGDVRQRGLMIGIELVEDRETKKPYDWRQATGLRVCGAARELGLLTRPLGDVITFLPPLATEDEDLEIMLDILFQAVGAVTTS